MTSQAGSQIVATIARNILRAREDANLTQREVGVALDMDARGISRWENGRVIPSPAKLAALAKLFDRDPGWFYTDHDQVAA